MKKIITLTIAVFLLTVSSSALFASEVSSDVMWTDMAKRYPISAVSSDAKGPSIDVLAAWWDTLGDETLTQLVKMSLSGNKDMASARAKVAEARAALGIAKAASLPWLDAGGYWNKSRTPVEKGGTASAIDLYRLGLDASWEIDIFGGRRATSKAAAAALEADFAMLYSAWVSLSSEVAINYISLRTLQESLAVAEENLALQTETLDLVASRVKAGLSDELALSQAKYTREQTKAAIPPIRENIEAVKNGLAILTGSVPGSLEDMLSAKKPIPKANMDMLVGIPANAMRQRPDIQAAERRLAAQIARKKSAQADLWPKFYLAGSIGTEALSTGSLFEGAAKAYSFGPKITLPIFHWGAIKNNIKVQGARQEQAMAAYEQTVLGAVGEVRNSLTSIVEENERCQSLKDGMDAAKAALYVANDKYKNGLTDFNNVIGAQQTLLSLSEQYTVSEGKVMSNLVRLFKALGGGFAPLDAEVSASSTKK